MYNLKQDGTQPPTINVRNGKSIRFTSISSIVIVLVHTGGSTLILGLSISTILFPFSSILPVVVEVLASEYCNRPVALILVKEGKFVKDLETWKCRLMGDRMKI